jgi:hypothetical protein
MDFGGLVVRDGDLVTASGRLVRNQAGDWFEPLLPVAAGGGPQRVRPVSRVAVRVAGADFDELAGRFEDGGAVEGGATLTGIWSAGQLRVQRQAIPSPRDARFPRWVMPPCPAPAGGWPRHGDKNLHFDLGDLRDTGAAVAVTVFRPDQDQAVFVVAAADPDAVEARLRPQLGERLCVVASRWTTAELDAVRAHLHARHRAWNLLQLGQSTSEDSQACIAAKLTRVLPEIALWAASLPAGILSLDPWLLRAHPQLSNP